MALATRVKTLLIHDNLASASDIPRLLRHDASTMQVELLGVTSVPEALPALEGGEVEVVMLELPRADAAGLAAVRRVREQAAQLPIVAITHDHDEAWGLQAIQAGAHDYLPARDLDVGALQRVITYAKQRREAALAFDGAHRGLEGVSAEHTDELQLLREKLAHEQAERRQVELALRSIARTTEDHLAEMQAILNSIAEGLIICDAEGHFLTMNPAALALLHFRDVDDAKQHMAEGAVGPGRLYDLNGRLLPVEEWPIQHIVRGHTITDMQVTVENERDGHAFIASFGGTPVWSADGHIILTLLTVRDITRSRRTEEALRLSEERFRTALKGTLISVFNQDRDLRYTWVYNPIGLYASDMIGRRDLDLLGGKTDLDALTRLKKQVLESGRSLRAEIPIRMSDDVHVFDISLEPLRDGEGAIIGITGASLDITELKRVESAEREQRQLAEALRDTAMALGSSLQLPDVLTLILENLERVVPHDAADIMLLEGDYAVVAGTRGHTAQRAGVRPTRRFLMADVPLLREMAETGDPQLIDDVQAVTEWEYLASEPHLHAYIGVPIWWQHHLIGLLNVFSAAPAFFTADHIDRMQVFAAQAALAIQNARQFEQAQQLAALEERQRLARDLHDAVNQSLFTASMLSESLLRFRDKDSDKVWEHLEKLHHTTRGALAEMHTLLVELRPEQLLNAPLGESLSQLVYALRGRKRLDISLSVDAQAPIDPELKIAFYRIAQEALTNIIKHAQATHIEVKLISLPGKIELHVEDNGKGFNVNALSAGFGLSAMRERAAAIGALWRISSSEGAGTRVTVIHTA